MDSVVGMCTVVVLGGVRVSIGCVDVDAEVPLWATGCRVSPENSRSSLRGDGDDRVGVPYGLNYGDS